MDSGGSGSMSSLVGKFCQSFPGSLCCIFVFTFLLLRVQDFILKDFFLVVKGSDLPVGERMEVANGTTVQRTGTKRKRADNTSDLEDSSDPVKNSNPYNSLCTTTYFARKIGRYGEVFCP